MKSSCADAALYTAEMAVRGRDAPTVLQALQRYDAVTRAASRGVDPTDLASGIVFAAVCGAGAGLSMWALVEQRGRTAAHYQRTSRSALSRAPSVGSVSLR